MMKFLIKILLKTINILRSSNKNLKTPSNIRNKQNEINSSNNNNNDYKQRARQLIQQTKQKSIVYEDFNSLTSSSPSTPSSSVTTPGHYNKPENVQLAKQLIADTKKRKLNNSRGYLINC
jgi:hypothetical protein